MTASETASCFRLYPPPPHFLVLFCFVLIFFFIKRKGERRGEERIRYDTNVLMNRPSARVIVGGGGWGKQQLFINDDQSME